MLNLRIKLYIGVVVPILFMIDFSDIKVNSVYDRPGLADTWGYKSFNAISRGVFTPKGENRIILFITKVKQDSLTQYIDRIDQDILFWEGEKGHASDDRIISRRDEINVFYRDRHHTKFIYQGRAYLEKFRLYKSRPSKFKFILLDRKVDEIEIVQRVIQSASIPETMKESIIMSRRGQGKYRSNVIDLWKTCSVTGFSNQEILTASHIKPWKISSNDERVNPYNSLLLVPTLDKLFDRGFVGFEHTGHIVLSENIADADWCKIGISKEMKLRQVPADVKMFLEFHAEYVFDIVQK